MNPRFLAVGLWLMAWLALDVAGILALRGIPGRGRLLSAAAAAATLFAAVVLANAGADLWGAS